MEVSSWENHLFLWAIYNMAMLNNQMVHGDIGDIGPPNFSELNRLTEDV